MQDVINTVLTPVFFLLLSCIVKKIEMGILWGNRLPNREDRDFLYSPTTYSKYRSIRISNLCCSVQIRCNTTEQTSRKKRKINEKARNDLDQLENMLSNNPYRNLQRISEDSDEN